MVTKSGAKSEIVFETFPTGEERKSIGKNENENDCIRLVKVNLIFKAYVTQV